MSSPGGSVGATRLASNSYTHSVEVTVYVHPDHHRRGHGRALYAALLPILERQGYRSIVAGITLPNEASVELHESFGFKRTATFERIGHKFDRWHDVGYWMLHYGSRDAGPGSIRAVAAAAPECGVSV